MSEDTSRADDRKDIVDEEAPEGQPGAGMLHAVGTLSPFEKVKLLARAGGGLLGVVAVVVIGRKAVRRLRRR